MKTKLDFLNIFADHLGWPALIACRHVFPLEDQCHPKDVVWYEAQFRGSCRLQINERPLFAAGVYAVRYELFSGFHRLSSAKDVNVMRSEAERLDEFLNSKWFRTKAGRDTFARHHPECTGWNNARLGTGEMPYEPR